MEPRRIVGGGIEVVRIAPLRASRNDGGDAKTIIQVQFVSDLPVILDELLEHLAAPDSECLGTDLGVAVCQAECQVGQAYAGSAPKPVRGSVKKKVPFWLLAPPGTVETLI